jgi:hypothetical protein
MSVALKEDFFNGTVGSGVQLGPLGSAATNRPIVPAPYDDGEIGGRSFVSKHREN